jgi:hypothetical protein
LGTNGTEKWDQNDGNIDERNGGLDDSMGYEDYRDSIVLSTR